VKRSGFADTPLHGGYVPAWLAERMTKLGTAIVESILLHYGHDAFLTRLSDPFWFQALGSVMGMDWHSSGITTSVMGALKRGLNSRASDLGLYVCGGRGKQSRRTPEELLMIADRQSLDGDSLVRASRLTAKIDNNCIADGFQIYLHSFVVTARGQWAVVQQGMNPGSGLARRYHWHSAEVRDFVMEPHTGIMGEPLGPIINLVDAQAGPAQNALLTMARDRPDFTLGQIRHLEMPRHHDVRAEDLDLNRIGAVLAVTYEKDLHSFADFLLTEKLGPRTLQTLAMVAEVIHGPPIRFSDPARYSLALGGKDGHPFPVPLKTYDASLDVLRRSLDAAKIDGGDKLEGFSRLNRFVEGVETDLRTDVDLPSLIAHEMALSPWLGGRSVQQSGVRPPSRARPSQMRLF